ncbi:DUF2637 domain-containing protein [Streptomyces sp. NBC_01142]|uniref:DUF2637 domain-containing protein n=1 Tax=Streptomyces sp. NBC_01142 TaxID=2975865 RepID=UPI0022575D94|nr:DUF2637 domain-containing protein [Streptomyces sp. NBC_01142]MCX4826526.1 DUF2637 domain-containing protein [Streptomyces sp. NBC_01142]
MIVGVVVGGAVVIAGIGFAGSYAAVRDLAIRKGFGTFAHVFPLGVDAGILVLLALDLLLTWLRMPFPMLRQTAWLLTSATIAFNGAAAWPDPLGVGMHAVIPILFVVTVEAARHAIGRIADITADKHMEGVRLIRWLLSPLPTFKLWRRMKLWELRSYDRVLELEQERLVYQARLRTRFGRAWRRKAPVEARLPLKLTRYGVPLNSGRALAPAPPAAPAPEGNALEAHVADALALTSTADGAPGLPAGEGMNVPSYPVNADVDAGVNPRVGQAPAPRPAAVNAAAGREPGTVKPDAGQRVNPQVHAPAGRPVNGSRGHGSRPGVNGSASVADSRMKPFTPSVNDASVNRVNSVNPLFTGTVNGFTLIVKPREFTREAETVNRPEWSVKQPAQLRVNHPADRESGGVNDGGGTVNSAPDKAVNEHPDDREEERVNGGDDGVNDRAVNSRRTHRAHAAKAPAPSSVHATVGAPSPEEAERAKAAADWFAAKKANPSLTQKDFVKELGRSPGWMTKALKEAARKAAAAADG